MAEYEYEVKRSLFYRGQLLRFECNGICLLQNVRGFCEGVTPLITGSIIFLANKWYVFTCACVCLRRDVHADDRLGIGDHAEVKKLEYISWHN